MRCLVLVKFLPGGSPPTDEFFSRIKAVWSWPGATRDRTFGKAGLDRLQQQVKASTAVCIAECESLEQLAADLAMMPGAGVSSVKVFPV